SEFGVSTVDTTGNYKPGSNLEIVRTVNKYTPEDVYYSTIDDITPEVARAAFDEQARIREDMVSGVEVDLKAITEQPEAAPRYTPEQDAIVKQIGDTSVKIDDLPEGVNKVASDKLHELRGILDAGEQGQQIWNDDYTQVIGETKSTLPEWYSQELKDYYKGIKPKKAAVLAAFDDIAAGTAKPTAMVERIRGILVDNLEDVPEFQRALGMDVEDTTYLNELSR
ncbi:unnamed protein product, partial [marine sediment metagenome]